MGSRVLQIPLDHIRQNYQESSNTYVEQGDLFTNDFNNVTSGHYSYELWFKIPDDIYKYIIGYPRPLYDATIIALKTDKSSLDKYVLNHYNKFYYKPNGRITYTNTTTNPPITTYDESISPNNYFSPIKFVEPSAFFQVSSSGSINDYLGEVEPDETGMTFQITRNERLSLQFVSGEYFVLLVEPFYSYRKFDLETNDYYTEDIYTKHVKWNTNSFVLELLLTDIDITINPTYPVDVYARKDRDLTVAWEVSNSDNRSETYLWVTESTITITDAEDNVVTYTITGDDLYHVFDTSDISDLAVGQCTVHVESTTNYGWVGEATWTFDLTGETNAPEITSVTQDSYPTIAWTAESQIAWELQISNTQGIVYKTGMVPGSDRSYTVPQLLEDGQYSLEMRCTNAYGIVTAWSSYFLELSPTKPDAPTNIVVSARADFGISVACDPMETTGKLLAVRRKNSDSEPEVLGEYNGSFVDYLVGLDDPHEYTIRNYEEGYADGAWVDGTLNYVGIVIRDAEDYSRFVHVWMSEDETTNYTYSEERSDVLTQCVGRKYPVAEIGEWITSTRTFSGYVSSADFKKLQKMKLDSNHVLLQSKEEYFPCYMEFSDQGEFINNGRIVNFRMTRIDGDK